MPTFLNLHPTKKHVTQIGLHRTSPFPYPQSTFPYHENHATFFIPCLKPLAFGEADLRCSPISLLGCFMNKPSLSWKPWHLRVLACSASGTQTWFRDTDATCTITYLPREHGKVFRNLAHEGVMTETARILESGNSRFNGWVAFHSLSEARQAT